MSTTIDQRVVEMRFDNKQFESNVATTMSTLEKLKKSLHLDGASKGLEEVNYAAKKVDMNGLGDSVETVRAKFSALQIMGVTALTNITNSAVNAGKRIASALTIDPIKTGLSEYETQIGAIQTILANTESKGTTLNDVNGALDELNEYADKTIYNFTEMTRNIGTFTAAGVDLDKSVSSIKGIANLAAISGSTSQQASTAMYQLSQAMASGTVKLMDWNSVVNAGMGGQVFQDALKRTAKAHGVAIDDIIKKQGSFRESLSEGWLTADILTETLTQFTLSAKEGSKEWEEFKESLKNQGYTDEQAESILKMANTATDAATKVKTFTQLWDTLKESAQSGWAQTWEILIGDFEEAKEFLTELSDLFGGIIGKSAESRNDMLENWKVLGGRDDLLQSIRNSFDAIASVINPISEAFREIFPPITAEQLWGFTNGLKELTAKMKLSDETSENLKRTFRGLFAVVDIVRQIFVAAFKAIGSILGVTGKLGGGILSITAVFGDWLVQIRDAITYSDIFSNVFSGIAFLVKSAIGWFGQLAEAISGSFVFEAASAGLNSLMAILTRTSDGADTLAESATKVKEAWMQTGLYQFLVKVWDVIKSVVSGIAKLFSGMFAAITDAFGSGDFESGFDLIKTLLEGGLLVALTTLITKIKALFDGSDGLMESIKGLVDNASGILDSFGDSLKAFQSKLKADALKSLAVAIAVLVASIVVLSFVDSEKLSSSLAAITILFVELSVLLTAVGKIKSDGDGIHRMAGTVIALGVALLLMATTMKIISGMDTDKAIQGFIGVAALLGVMTTVTILISKFAKENKGINQGARAMVVMGIALLAISGAIAILGSMNAEKLIQGGLGVLGVLGILVGVQSLMQLLDASKVVKGAAAMTIMAASIAILVPSLLILGVVPYEKLIQGGLGVLGVLTVLVGAQAIMQLFKVGKVIKGAAAMAIMVGALTLIIPSLLIFGMLPVAMLAGVAGMLGVLTVLVGAQAIMQLFNVGTVIKGAAALTIMAASFLVISAPLLMLAVMPWQSLLQGGIALISLMTLMVGAQAIMQLFNPAKLMATSAALVVMASSILILAPALLLLGSMGIERVGVALAAIAGALIILGAAAAILNASGLIPAMLALSTAVAGFGTGIAALGAGVLLFGLGLSAIGVGLTALASGIGGLGVIVAELFEIILVSIPKMRAIGVELVIALCDAIIDCAAKIVDTVLIVVLEVLRGLVEFVPSIVAALVSLITGIINALSAELPGLVKAVVELLFAFVKGVLDALGAMDAGGELTKALMNTTLITLILVELAAMAALTPAAMVGVLGMASVMTELAVVLAGFGAIASVVPGLEKLIGKGGNLLQAIGTAVGQFIGGLVGGFAKGATDDLPEIGKNLSGFAREIGDFLSIAPTLASAMASIAGASIADSIADMFKFGGSSMDVFRTELPKLGEGLAGFSDAIGDRSFDNIENAAKGAAALAKVAYFIPCSGGLVSALIGKNSIAQFGKELTDFARGLAGFSDEIGDRSFDNIGSAVEAARALADISNAIPNSGGVVSWFTGENAISKFGNELSALGRGIANFSDRVADSNLEKTNDAVEAAKGIVELTNAIPNTGGVISWFTGENAIAKYASELGFLGRGIYNFADKLGDADLAKVKAAAEAGKVLAEMTNIIPKEGGVAAWFSGETAIANFADELASLGHGISNFASETNGISVDTIGPAVDAATKLAEMTSVIPNEGGIGAWFSGESALSKFGNELYNLGCGIADFAMATSGITPDTVGPAADAAAKLAEMTSVIPNEGGIAAWFSGESALAKFASELGKLGTGVARFARNAEGVTTDTVAPAVDAATKLAEMTSVIPKEGGIKAWFSGESAMVKFADELPTLGSGLTEFSKSVGEINPDNVTAAASAAKSLGDMTSVVPKDSSHIGPFGDNLKAFGTSLKTYFSETSGINAESVSGVKDAVSVVERIAKINSSGVQSIATAVDNVVGAMKSMSNVAKDASSGVKAALDDIAKVNVETLNGIAPDMKKAGRKAITEFAAGIKEAAKQAKTACKDLATSCIESIKDKYDSFKSAGKYVVEGFAAGIDANTFKAKAEAKAMAKAALEAAEEALDENSPSKEFYRIGAYGGEGFVNALGDYGKISYNAGSEMAGSAKNGLQDAISKISRAINGDMEMQPTIRPVLDLSDVRSGVGTIGELFGTGSVGVLANVNSVSAMMSRHGQNGGNEDVVSAINKLNKKLDNAGNTYYNIDGVTYDDGSNIAGAVKSIVRAVKVERRT